MESLKKVISLSEASKISGYHQDYLSFLIRKKEIKGKKIGGNWFTTEEEIKNYIFKQKIQRRQWAIKDFLSSSTRINNIFLLASMLAVFIFISILFYQKENQNTIKAVNTKLSDTNELGVIKEISE